MKFLRHRHFVGFIDERHDRQPRIAPQRHDKRQRCQRHDQARVNEQAHEPRAHVAKRRRSGQPAQGPPPQPRFLDRCHFPTLTIREPTGRMARPSPSCYFQ